MPAKKYVLERKLQSGKHSSPVVVSKEGKRIVFKRSSMGKGLTLAQAREMTSSVRQYHRMLNEAGVRTSQIKGITPMPEKNKGFFVASVEEYIGKRNVAEIFEKCSQSVAKRFFREMLNEIYKAVSVPSKKGPNKTGLPIDSKPKNYVVGKDGKVVFVDFYTPKLIGPDGKLEPYFSKLHPTRTRKELQLRFEDKRAILHILLAHSIEARPEFRQIFEREVFNFLESKNEGKILDYVKGAAKKDYRSVLIKPDTIARIKNRK